MTRRKRDTTSASIHHVVNGGIDGQDIFDVPEDRALFEGLLLSALEATGARVHAFAWMTNHIHAIVEHEHGDALRAAIGLAEGKYARVFNQRTQRDGPLWQPRFWSTPITDDAQLLTTVRYIHRNPLPITGTAGLSGYEYSSLRVYVGHSDAPSWLTTTLVGPLIDPVRHLRIVLSALPSDRIPVAFLPPMQATTVGEIIRSVRTVAGRSSAAIAWKRLTITLALQLRSADLMMLASRLDISPKTARNHAAHGRRQMIRDPLFAMASHAVLHELGT